MRRIRDRTRRISSRMAEQEVFQPMREASSAESAHEAIKRAFTAPVGAPMALMEQESFHEVGNSLRPSLVDLISMNAISKPSENLALVRRSCSFPSEFALKRMPERDSLLVYRGVTRRQWETRFDASILVEETLEASAQLHLGSFDTSHAAARAVDVARLRLGHRDDELFNFPLVDYAEIVDFIDDVSLDDLAKILVELSQNSERRTSRFRGVTAAEGGFVARLDVGW